MADRRFDSFHPTRGQWAALIAVGCTLLYYLTRTPALDEWDSIQFALGVGEFNLWKHQPHPPGYPLYIAFGWLAERLLGLSARNALALGSALGGGMFVAGWFALIARRFAFPVAALSALTLAGLVNTWMSATKVLTDPLGTGLLTLALVWLDGPTLDQQKDATFPPWRAHVRLSAGALTAAAAVGVRPQNLGVLLLIVILAVRAQTQKGQVGTCDGWMVGMGVFFTGCLAWLVPVLAIQAHTPESGGNWWAYGGQLIAQWRWRLDQPKAFLGAVGGQEESMLLYRLDHHVLGWFTRGFGFSVKSVPGWIGIAVILAGWGMYVTTNRPRDRGFWWTHLPWSLAYVAMIFCCLPGDQRYYLPIFPLFIVAAVAGWWLWLRGPWRWAAAAVPVAALAASLPLVVPNHKDEPPPVQMVRWLNARYPSGEQAAVWLILRDTRRHAEWYAPGFHIFRAELFNSGNPPEGLEQASAVYTDDPMILPFWPRATRVGHYERSPLIYRKHNEVDLYRLDPAQPSN